MEWYYYVSLVSFFVCVITLGCHLTRLIRLGKPEDFALPAGSPLKGIQYSFTRAMNPFKKESAYLHLPTYTAGIFYHLGSFLSMLLFFFIWFGRMPVSSTLAYILAAILMLTGGCGIAILIKRVSKRLLLDLSNPDDYLSNVLVTLFQGMTALLLSTGKFLSLYFIAASLLMLWFPVGKLRHALYFFSARYHLGFFYGYRGVWPPWKLNKFL
ncbi:MAG: hypothetical protein NTU44_03490 [Bacteroidetes bacterium]|nr:hypothetical protein [Bacteroidota bacterium]